MNLTKILSVTLLCGLPAIYAHANSPSIQSLGCYASRTSMTYSSSSEKLFSGSLEFQEDYSEVKQLFAVDNLYGWISRNPKPNTVCMGLNYLKGKEFVEYGKSCGPIPRDTLIQLKVLVGDTSYYLGCDPK